MGPVERASSEGTSEALASLPPRDLAPELADLWRELTSGVLRIRESYLTETHHCLVLARTEVRSPSSEKLAVLERVLCGESTKSVALDSGISPSAVTLRAVSGLRSMGFDSPPSRAPLLLVLAARAGAGMTTAVSGWREDYIVDGTPCVRLKIARSGLQVPAALSSAEQAVVRLIVERRSQSEIASQRRTSQRTVANQLASVFRKLGVSGRKELIDMVAEAGVAAPPSSSASRLRTVESRPVGSEVDELRAQVGELRTQVTGLLTQIEALKAQVRALVGVGGGLFTTTGRGDDA